jgi:plastocyanin
MGRKTSPSASGEKTMNSRLTLIVGVVLLVAATATGCGGGSNSMSSSPASPSATPPVPTSSPASAAVVISIVGMNGANSYAPNPATVQVGQAVAWRNADAVAHTATADGGAFDTGSIAPGATSNPITMNTAGSFPYHCTIHGFVMTGTLTVTAGSGSGGY